MSNQQDFMIEILKGLREKDTETTEEKQNYEEDLQKLGEAYTNLLKKENFKLGQLVRWKKYLKNRKLPNQNQPAIVVKVLEEPIISSDDETGSPYFLEKLDIILGVMSKDDEFLTFYYESSRFESYYVDKPE